jgi:hypothetical protein
VWLVAGLPQTHAQALVLKPLPAFVGLFVLGGAVLVA